MKFLPMYRNTQGMPDLVHHTVKHFFGDSERARWDTILTGTLTAKDAWAAVCHVRAFRPSRGDFPKIAWCESPWIEHVQRAHDEGYRPRYEKIAKSGGDPLMGAWQPTGSMERRFFERVGFRLVVERKDDDFQIITAYHRGDRTTFTGAPLRAFEQRRHSLVSLPNGVHPPERTS